MAFSIATFNVKDLIDPVPRPGEDAAAAAAGRLAFDAKLDWLAEMIARLDADVLGMQEVGSAAILAALCDRPPLRGKYPERVLGTGDDRGIRNALLARAPLMASTVHAPRRLDFPVLQAGDPPPFGDRIPMRRGIVHASVDAGALGRIEVLVAHLKSKRRMMLKGPDSAPGVVPSSRELAEGELRSLVWRCSEALFVRGLVDAMLQGSGDARVVVMGDLNDGPGSLVRRIVDGLPPTELWSAASLVPTDQRFSILHRGTKELFDHVLVTQNLFVQASGAHLYNEALRDHGELGDVAQAPGAPPAEPAVTPDSDHAPLVVRFG